MQQLVGFLKRFGAQGELGLGGLLFSQCPGNGLAVGDVIQLGAGQQVDIL